MKNLSLLSGLALSVLLLAPACGGSDDDDDAVNPSKPSWSNISRKAAA